MEAKPRVSWAVEVHTKSELSSRCLHQEWAEQWRYAPRVCWAVEVYTKSELSNGGPHQEWAEQWRSSPRIRWAVEVHTKSELSGGGSLRHLNTFSNLSDVTVHYTHQHVLCNVAISDYTHVHHKIIRTYHRVSYSFPLGLGNIAQENTTADILVEDQLWPPLDSLPGARTPQT